MGNSTTWWEVIHRKSTTWCKNNLNAQIIEINNYPIVNQLQNKTFLIIWPIFVNKVAPSFVLFYVKGKYDAEENVCQISNRNIFFIDLSEPNEMYVVFVIVWAKI